MASLTIQPFLRTPVSPYQFPCVFLYTCESQKPVTIQSLLGEYLALLSQQYGIWMILLNMNGPFTGLNGVAWQWPVFPSSLLCTPNNIQWFWHFSLKSTKEELAVVPETLKALKPQWDASTWHKRSDFFFLSFFLRQWANHTVPCEI